MRYVCLYEHACIVIYMRLGTNDIFLISCSNTKLTNPRLNFIKNLCKINSSFFSVNLPKLLIIHEENTKKNHKRVVSFMW